MIAVFSLPLFALWAMSDVRVPSRVRMFRVSLTLLAALCMGVIILVRQRILDRELVRLLDHSREAFEHLKRLQAKILQSEKLASIGQLVGGAAHELNNPITAMLGYSDLLSNTPLTSEQKPMAAKIGQYVRRTKSLVASLISFSRQAAPKTPLDLNTLARTAVKLTEPNWRALDIDVQTRFDAALPKVLGDSNQLLQVCFQLLGNCLHVLSERGGGSVLTVSTERKDCTCLLQIATQALPRAGTEQSADCSPLDPEDALGMSACQGILQEHHGRVFRERREDGSLLMCMELPTTVHMPETANGAMPVSWQSQPFA
jgi:signal transduction histidine kinase